ncbi:hypothetical protein PASE110613_06025 [Paenibacillus sediminis]|uniref:DUF4252 domain-containing protein n=1 Tax=Paenibacillus sediminis TaxID=664909 RepID=A0ABS4H248_9BACL|nr:hypothetical protein [Paenibacillus sediminis]MBP1936337.1 hypothetical protein [Paenibacillus sediminis]
MRHGIKLFILISIVISVVGCAQMVKTEADKYNMKANREGNLRAQTQGKGLNGHILQEMKRLFAERNIELTNEMYAEGRGGEISYMYFLNGNPQEFVTLHIYKSPKQRMKRIKELYGKQNVITTSTSKIIIYSYDKNALVYSSIGSRRGANTIAVKDVFSELVRRLD